NKWQQPEMDRAQRIGVVVEGIVHRRQFLVGVVEIMGGQADLFEVVGTLRAGRRLAHLLHRRHEQRDENGNDGNHYQKLDERETARLAQQLGEEHAGSFTTWNEGMDSEKGPSFHRMTAIVVSGELS